MWDSIYRKYQSSELPWFGIKFPNEIIAELNELEKEKTLLIPGCGTGETAETIKGMGFKETIGTDTSEVAIESAKKNFPGLEFKKTKTQELHQMGFKDVNVFDWMNLHHISKKKIVDYLSSLQIICKTLILSYIYESGLVESRPSIITGDECYNHKPDDVMRILKKLNVKRQFSFEIKSNPKFKKISYKAAALVFRK